MEESLPRIAVSYERKVSDGNYGSIGTSCVLSGITVKTTDAELTEMLDAADVAFSVIRKAIDARIAAAKAAAAKK